MKVEAETGATWPQADAAWRRAVRVVQLHSGRRGLPAGGGRRLRSLAMLTRQGLCPAG